MNRLHSRIYFHVLAVLLIVGVATTGVFSWGQRGLLLREVTQRLARHLASQLGDRPLLTSAQPDERARLQQVLRQLHQDFQIDLSVRDLSGEPLAIAGRLLPAPAPDELSALRGGQDVYQRRSLAAMAPIREPASGRPIALLQMSPPRHLATGGIGWLWRPLAAVAFVLFLVAVASLPLARRITRPIDLLTEASRRLGAGELSYRIPLPSRCLDESAPPPPLGRRAAVARALRWARRRHPDSSPPLGSRPGPGHRPSHALSPGPWGGPPHGAPHGPWGGAWHGPSHGHWHGPHPRRRDELLDLMYAWNDMAERIEGLMRGQRELLANVSHELRSPLARVRLALELLPRDAESESRLTEIEGDLGELDRLIEDVLITSRLQATGLPTHPAELALRPLLEQVLDRARSHPQTASLPLKLAIEEPSDSPLTVFADGNLLKRALSNLIENAGKYGAPPIVLSARQRADFLDITVQDHGPGIPESERERVLEPFYRGDKAHTPSPTSAPPGERQGYGLGLTLARRVAEAHGGRITITDAPPQASTPSPPSTPGTRGCCITLSLPLRPAE